MTTEAPTYAFYDDAPVHTGHSRKHRRKKSQRDAYQRQNAATGGTSISYNFDTTSSEKQHDADTTDGNGSLTYSASSSIQSNSSATGESTDSSFADSHLMKVLDIDRNNMQHSAHIDHLLGRSGSQIQGMAEKEMQQHVFHQQNGQRNKLRNRSFHRDSSSIADSLGYSEDGENSYYGHDNVTFPQTITGQPSDSHGPDGGSDSILFAPATLEDLHGHRSQKVPRIRQDKSLSPKSSHRSKYVPSSPKESMQSGGVSSSPATVVASDVSVSSSGTPTSPPPRNPKRSIGNRGSSSKTDINSEVWYAKWWMCGFTDALNLNEKYM